ncbi:MAG: hypothetical protein KGR98_11525, partial [Verrucomicrobia bacterium]|nr:hypothetical protein [Verrucomicrobiota bacterium]
VGDDYVKDIYTITGDDVKVSRYGDHPIVASLKANDLALQMIRPRPVLAATPKDSGPQGPKVTELAFSSQQSTLGIETNVPPRAYPLMAAVQQAQDGAAAGGVARIVVVGDSFCFGNYYIQGGANRDFAGFTVNWLVDRPGLLQGIGPRPMSEFRLMLTPRQRLDISWLLLGALPGGVLLLGGIIWMTRRK